MSYADNPRKIYGRVDIIYSDSDISSDIIVSSNSTSEIDRISDVYKGYIEPSFKACTLDGNSNMDGTFQMIDNTCIAGWWSKVHCDSNGFFNEIVPSLELSFIKRPIITWLILGDTKLNQYPVDFTIKYYNEDVLIKADEVLNNDKLEVKFEPLVEDITKIELKISKWSTPNACVKILKFFDRLFERYEGDTVKIFEVSEEMGSAEGGYNITSNVMSVSLYNQNRKFDKGYLRSLMLLDRKLIPYVGVQKQNEIEYTQLGVFYSDEWQISQDSQWVKCSAVDKLMRLQNKVYIGLPLTLNMSVKEILEDIFISLNLKQEEYIISESLNNDIIPYAFIPKCSYWDAFQEIANCALCQIFIDRLGGIVVGKKTDTKDVSGIAITPSNMFSSTSNITLTEFANEIKVSYNEISLGEIISVVDIVVTLLPNEKIRISVDYSSEISDALVYSSNQNIKITEFKSSINYAEFYAENLTNEYQQSNITVDGNALVINSLSVKARDENSIKQFGITEYNHPNSDLIQTYDQAKNIAETLLIDLRAGEGTVSAVWRGSPGIELNDEYVYLDRFGENSKLICEYNRLTFDGSFRQETRGRKVLKED